ncbi:MAG: hypothetical protein RLY86_25 [Pseudomonadota bacterium]
MPLLDALILATFIASVILIFATAANDAASGLAGVFSSATTTPRAATLIGSVAAAVGLLLISSQPVANVLDMVAPLSGWRADTPGLAIALLAVSIGTAIAAVGATMLGVPVPILLVQVFALASVGAVSGAGGDPLGVLLMTGAVFLIVVIAGMVGYGCIRAAGAWLLGVARPRDRIPVGAGIVVGAAVLLGLGGLVVQAPWPAGIPPWALVVVPLMTALTVGLSVMALLRRYPFPVSNDPAGAEAVFRTFQLAVTGGVMLAFGAVQALAAAFPVGLVLALRDGMPDGWAAGSPLNNVAAGILLVFSTLVGVLFGGHRVARWMGDSLLPTGPVGGTAVSVGVLGGGTALAAAGLPILGNQAVVGAMLGVGAASGQTAAIWRPLGRILAGWVVAPVAGSVAAVAIYGLGRAVIG